MDKKTIIFKDCFTTDKENIEQAKKRIKRKNVDTTKTKTPVKTAKAVKETWKEIKEDTCIFTRGYRILFSIKNRFY
jgi:uncharacterized protein YpuA (DUF1002 family)